MSNQKYDPETYIVYNFQKIHHNISLLKDKIVLIAIMKRHGISYSSEIEDYADLEDYNGEFDEDRERLERFWDNYLKLLDIKSYDEIDQDKIVDIKSYISTNKHKCGEGSLGFELLRDFNPTYYAIWKKSKDKLNYIMEYWILHQ